MPLDNRYIRGTDLEVLAYNLNLDLCFSLITDIIQPVLQRFELKSRSALMDEQSNSWELLHPRAALIQHRILLSSFILDFSSLKLLFAQQIRLFHQLFFLAFVVVGRFLAPCWSSACLFALAFCSLLRFCSLLLAFSRWGAPLSFPADCPHLLFSLFS